MRPGRGCWPFVEPECGWRDKSSAEFDFDFILREMRNTGNP
jgi:hypothetical protein